jgi:hypothetical protein
MIMLVLIILSVLFFGLQQLIFCNLQETLYLFFQDLLFLPLQILLVTFVLNKVIESREKQERLEQINIVISAFFSDIGTEAINTLNPLITEITEIKRLLDMNPEWGSKEFQYAEKDLKAYRFHAEIEPGSLEPLKAALLPKKAYLLQMFSNPNLLEHNTFTDMLWALYHVIDELENRTCLQSLPGSDISHLSNDIVRAYGLLVYEWVLYTKHLKDKYPYLWSLAVRKNPFAGNSVIVR